MSLSSSYVLDSPTSSSQDDLDTDSLPSSPSSSTFSTASHEDPDSDDSDAERQWIESLQQLELLLTMVLVPYVGKYFGRKCAYWGWAKWMEWHYPVEVVVTDRRAFRGAGMVEAAL